MTYPSHMLGAIDADGAFTVGGDWGQGHTEASIRALWTVPKPTIGNALGALRSSLLKLPLEALRGFEGLIQGVGEGVWSTVTGAVDAIMGAVRNIPVFLQVDKWDDWLAASWNNLKRMVDQIVEIFTGLIVVPINEAIQGVKDWFGSFVSNAQATAVKAQSIVNNIIKGWKNDFTATGSVDDLTVVFGEARAVKYGLITLADLANAPTNVPFYVSPNPFEEPSFPRSQLESVVVYNGVASSMSASGSSLPLSEPAWTTQRSTLNDHDHDIVLTPSYQRPRFTIFSGNMALSAKRATTNRIINSARFIAGGDTPPTHVYAYLYEINPVNGNMTMIYDFGDVRAEIPTGPLLYEVGLETEGDIVVSAGALIALGILPVGGSFTVAGVTRSQIVPTVTIYPQAATELLSGLTVGPETILETSLNHTASFRMWSAIGQVLPETITPVSLLASFDAYTDTANWVSPAFAYRGNGRFRISNGMLVADGPLEIAPHDYVRQAIALQACSSNDMYSSAVIGGGWSGQNFSQGVDVMVRLSQDGQNGVVARITQIGDDPAVARIYTISGGVRTQRAESTTVFQALPTDTFRLDAVGNTYGVFRNDDETSIVGWIDDTSIVNVGAAWRRVGFGHTAASYGARIYRSAPIDTWSGGDIVIAEEPEPEEPPAE